MSENITYEKLAAKFRGRKLRKYGFVLIVPGDKFNPDWETQLGEDYECIEETYYSKPVTLVRKVVAETKEKTSEEKPLNMVKQVTEDDLLELRAYFDRRIDALTETVSVLRKALTELQEKINKLKETFEEHEHSASGKIMVPLKKSTL